MVNEVLTAAQHYHSQGFVPLPLCLPESKEQQGKKPLPSIAKDWPEYEVQPADFMQPVNIGLVLGERSEGLTDIDLDWPECADLALMLLPQSWSYGRHCSNKGTRLTHLLYRCEGVKTLKLKAPATLEADNRKQTIIELRATGCQSVVPPSKLWPDEQLHWIDDPSLTDLHAITAERLTELVQRIAGAALLVRLWPDFEGGRHDLVLALAGSCLHAGWEAGQVLHLFGALLEAVHDTEKADRLRAVKDTIESHKAGQPVSGFATLAEQLPTDVLSCLQKWWRLGSNGLERLTFSGQAAAHVAAESVRLRSPEPLHNPLPAAPAFPMDALPDLYRPYVADVAELMQCPPDFPAVGLMVVTAGIVGGQLAVQPKQLDSRWQEIPNLWGGIVGNAGLLKTPALAEPMKLIQKLEGDARARYEAELSAYEAAKLAHEKQLTDAKNNKADAEALQAILANKPQPPVRKRYVINDATTEKVAELLADNPNGLLQFRDELTGWLSSMEKERNQGDRKFYLECWTGKTGGTVDRIGRGTIDIPRHCLSVLGGIQTGPMRSYLHQTLEGGFNDDGLFQRFQLLVWPEAPRSTELIDRLPDKAAAEAVQLKLWELAEIDVQALDAVPPPTATPSGTLEAQPFLRFAPEVQPGFNDWYAELMREINSCESEAMQAHLSKFRGLIPSLALLIHLADNSGPQITQAALDKALLWYGYLLGMARRIYGAVPLPEVVAAELVIERKQRLPDPFTARELQRKGWAGLKTKNEVLAALDELCEAHHLREEYVTAGVQGGRPSTLYHWNKDA